jgi:phosphoribosylformylglycinamidine (FGAM) synthase-like amidotransferase family enzyme
MESIVKAAGDGMPVLGICNGSRSSARRTCCPAA